MTTRVRERLAFAALLVATAVFYLWNITVNGMGNQFYAAATQAGAQSWKALLFGSLDSQNFITVDKPPVSQWVMGLSGQIFGFSSASMLIPQALMAVASVGLVYGAVRRVSGPGAGLLAGALLATVPVAALMFRFDNPDAVMVLLMTAGAYCTVRAVERGSARWIAFAGVALGFAFLAKMLEGLMVVPALALAYLVAAPIAVGKRLLHLLGALAALVVASGWYVVLTILWPADSRPYLAGSTDNSFMNLVFGYNGFARVLGRNHPQGPGGAGGAAGPPHGNGGPPGGFGGFGGQTRGVGRLFSGEFGFEIGWLLPAALLGVVLVVAARWGRPRTDLVRAGVIVFGGWLVVDGIVLSFMKGTIHPYYTLSIAPAVAGATAIAVHEMWSRRETWFGRAGLASLTLVAGGWSFWLLQRNDDWLPPLRWILLALNVIAVAALLLPRVTRLAAVTIGVVALVASLGGSTAYAVETLGQAHTGGNPVVGPASQHQMSHGGFAGMFGQTPDDPQLDSMLASTNTRWSAAIDRSSAAAALELSSRTAVMAVGGFSGSDPAPTLPQFRDYVRNHDIAYYLVPDRPQMRPQTGGDRAQRPSPGAFGFGRHTEVSDWVTHHFASSKVGSTTVYDLSKPKT